MTHLTKRSIFKTVALSAVAAMRLTRETTMVKMTSDGQSVELRQEAVTALQQSLTLKGLYKGPANGVSSPALISAMASSIVFNENSCPFGLFS